MKKLMISAFLLSSTILFAGSAEDNYAPVKPLWEEDQHFCYYRTLCIEGSVATLGSLLEEAKESINDPDQLKVILDKMDDHVVNCKNALGWPKKKS